MGPWRWRDSHFSLPPTWFIMSVDSDCPCVDTSITQKDVMCCRPRMPFKQGEGYLFQAHTYLVSWGHEKGMESDIRNRLAMINMREPTHCVLIPSEIFICVHPINTECLTQRTEPSLINLPNLTLTSQPTYSGTQAIQCTLSGLAFLSLSLSLSFTYTHTNTKVLFHWQG